MLAVVGWLGLAAILWSALSLDDGIAYPGPYALVPTLGAAAMIIAGASQLAHAWHWDYRRSASLAGSPTRSTCGTGPSSSCRRSCSGPAGSARRSRPFRGSVTSGPAPGPAHPARLVARIVLVAVSIAVATISCLAIEEPFRGSVALVSRPRRTLGLAFATLATVISLAGVLALGVSRQFDDASVADFGGQPRRRRPS